MSQLTSNLPTKTAANSKASPTPSLIILSRPRTPLVQTATLLIASLIAHARCEREEEEVWNEMGNSNTVR